MVFIGILTISHIRQRQSTHLESCSHVCDPEFWVILCLQRKFFFLAGQTFSLQPCDVEVLIRLVSSCIYL